MSFDEAQYTAMRWNRFMGRGLTRLVEARGLLLHVRGFCLGRVQLQALRYPLCRFRENIDAFDAHSVAFFCMLKVR